MNLQEVCERDTVQTVDGGLQKFCFHVNTIRKRAPNASEFASVTVRMLFWLHCADACVCFDRMNSISINVSDSKPIAYAWPGGYPVYYLAKDAFRHDDGTLEAFKGSEHVACPACVGPGHDSIVTAQDINWEDTDLHCDECGKRIESAYAEENQTTA